MNQEPQARQFVGDEIFRAERERQRAFDRRWCYLMVVGMACGTALHFPLNVIQVSICGIRLVQKIFKLAGCE